jgi:zinc D-Ala-D-Ala carboxypeptidase
LLREVSRRPRPTARPPRHATARPRRRIVPVAIAALVAAFVGALFYQPPTRSSSATTTAPAAPAPAPAPAPEPADAAPPPRREPQVERPATGLDPALLAALQQATADAARAGIEVRVTSGWRSPEHQQQLLNDAIAQYGSAEEAARWVATPETSPHVSGDAVDLAPAAATAWLAQHGAAYGLCQIYANEPWHYELRPDATRAGCPPLYADPTQDPRMRR